MITIDKSIYEWLRSQSSITDYVGLDIFHAASPSRLVSDYIVYKMEIPSNEPYSFVSSNTAQPSFRFDVYSKNAYTSLIIGNLLVDLMNRFCGWMDYDTDPLHPSLTLYPSETLYPSDTSEHTFSNNVIFSVASGPITTRTSDEQWYVSSVFWTPEYER